MTEIKGIELGKRTYLSDVKVVCACTCGALIEWDGRLDYVSHPVTGQSEALRLYCCECEAEYELPYRLDLKLAWLGSAKKVQKEQA